MKFYTHLRHQASPVIRCAARFTAGILLASTSVDANEASRPEQGPNILFIIADDIGKEMFGAYGNKFIETPHFDKLASEGVLFTNAFTTNGKCSPSRASILTGRHFFQLGTGTCHNRDFPKQFPTYPDILTQNGYHSGYTGKGWGPGKWKTGGRKVPPSGKAYNSIPYAKDHGPRVGFREEINPKIYQDVKVRALGVHSGEKMKELVFTGNVWNIDYNRNFDRFLSNKPGGKPFCFWFGSNEAHAPWLAGSGKKYKGNIDQVEVPPYYPKTDYIKNYLLDFAVEVELFDSQIGEAVATLKKHGLYENTIIVVTSDNGTAGLRNKGDTYPSNLNMPFIIHYPAKLKKGVNHERVNFSDLAPTFLDVAGVEVPSTMTGTSFKPLLDGKEYKGDKVMFGGRETYSDRFVYPARMIQQGNYYYIRNYYYDTRHPIGVTEIKVNHSNQSITGHILEQKEKFNDARYWNWCVAKRPYEELYDLSKDPFCLNNLAALKEHQEKKNQLSKLLSRRLKADKDPRELHQTKVIREWDNSKPKN